MLTLKDRYLIKSLHPPPPPPPTVKTSEYVLRVDVWMSLKTFTMEPYLYLFIYCSEMNEVRNASCVKI